MNGAGYTHAYSSCPVVSRMSRSATSSSMTHCLRYESKDVMMKSVLGKRRMTRYPQ